MERSIWSFYIDGEIWRELFGAVILTERYNKGWRELFGAVRSFYNWGGMWRKLFGALILMGRYNKGWRELFGAVIIGEGSREACSKQLY